MTDATDHTIQWRTHRIDRADDVLGLMAQTSKNYSMIYRGQARDWPLVPSIQRLFDAGHSPAEIAIWESAAAQNFRRHARAYLPSRQIECLGNMLGTLTLMQHYGAPTRLLDWTFSPWVALYFAVAASPEQDGVLWAFDRDLLSRSTDWGIDAAPDKRAAILEDLNRFTGAINVAEWIKYSAISVPAFTTFIYEFADPRISAQQSLFTFSGTLGSDHADELVRRLPVESRFRLIVPSAIKRELTNLLWRMNIGPLSLFPGIDGVGRFVNDAIRSHLPIDHAGRAWVLRETNDGRDLGLS